MDRRELKQILKRILNQPTAPFHEALVASEIESFAAETGHKLERDSYGNCIIKYKPKGRARKGRIGFVAHMDHPGFEIVSSKGKRAMARWYGGVWREYFRNAAVMVHHDGGVKGRVVKTTAKDGMPNRVESMELLMESPVPQGCFGQWDLVPYKMDGQRVVTRAADDLCSVVTMLALLRALLRENVRHEIWLIFTRAEENGFNGAMAMVEGKMLPKDMPLISLETSKILPEAEQGGGPVIRLGDKINTYTPGLLLYMEDCARKLLDMPGRFKYQRRVMDGGMCEASLFVCYGFPSAGIAFPLGNYHNMGDEPGPDGRPGLKAETVHILDLQYGVDLMLAICRDLSDYPKAIKKLAKRLKGISRPFYGKLKENPV